MKNQTEYARELEEAARRSNYRICIIRNGQEVIEGLEERLKEEGFQVSSTSAEAQLIFIGDVADKNLVLVNARAGSEELKGRLLAAIRENHRSSYVKVDELISGSYEQCLEQVQLGRVASIFFYGHDLDNPEQQVALPGEMYLRIISFFNISTVAIAAAPRKITPAKVIDTLRRSIPSYADLITQARAVHFSFDTSKLVEMGKQAEVINGIVND